MLLDSVTRHWLKENTGGVVLIQIRDHRGQGSFCNFTRPSGPSAVLLGSFDFLMSPPAGYMMSRYSTSSFRNDEQIVSLRQSFEQDLGCDPEFFKSVIFEFDNEADVALSWQLTEEEIRSLHGSIGEDQNMGKLKVLCDWWKADRGTCGRPPSGKPAVSPALQGPTTLVRDSVPCSRAERSGICRRCSHAVTPRQRPASSGPRRAGTDEQRRANPGGE